MIRFANFATYYSRDIETEADDVGLEMAARACIDVREAPNFWAKMAAMSAMDPDGDEQQPPEILSTHPAHESRFQRLTELLPRALETRSACGCARLPFNFETAMRRAREKRKIIVETV